MGFAVPTGINEKTPGAWQGDEGKSIKTEQQGKASIVNQVTSVPTTTDKNWNGHTDAAQHAIDEAEAQAWFDARPNIQYETVSSVVRGNREPVWTIIFDRFFEMHKIAQAKRAEKRRNATVATAAGFIVEPDSLLMKSLANGDNAHEIERGRFIVTVGASL